MTSRKELFEIFDVITEKAFQIMEGKNSDYASDEDSLANFRSSEVLNVDPRKALLIRMLDKIKRQVNYIERGELSVDSAEDDIIDLINYSVLLHALNREQEDKSREECLDEMTRIAQEMGEYDVDNWGVDELKKGLTWLDKHHYPATKEEVDLYNSKSDTKEYILLEDIDGFGKEGDTFIAPPHYKIWEYVNEDNEYREIDLENDDRIRLTDELKDYISREKATKQYGLCDCENTKTCVKNVTSSNGTNANEYKLCYVEDNIAYFTNDFENQWGDDWNDAPYEHNAGYPYNDDDNIIAIEFGGNFVTPDDGYINSPYSVEDINNGEYWWLFNKDKKRQLYAGASIQDFQDFIERNGGEIVNGLKGIDEEFDELRDKGII